MTLTITTSGDLHANDRVNIVTDQMTQFVGTVLWCDGAQCNVALGGREFAFQRHDGARWTWTQPEAAVEEAEEGPLC